MERNNKLSSSLLVRKILMEYQDTVNHHHQGEQFFNLFSLTIPLVGV
tara:strand:+ start:387 stop:527 length:141 start_codon:yes stop_codon:yes gene_type:complete